jgi:hypothetical protein
MIAYRHHPAVAAALQKFPGAEIVDVREAPAESAAPAEGQHISLAALAEELDAEARRIRAVQDGLVAEGDRDVAHPQQVYKARCFEASARVLNCIRQDEPMSKRLRELLARPEAAPNGPAIGVIRASLGRRPADASDD